MVFACGCRTTAQFHETSLHEPFHLRGILPCSVLIRSEFGVEYEAIPILGFSVLGLILVLVPFLDPEPTTPGRRRFFNGIGIVGLAYAVGMTAYGYRSLTSVWLVLGTALFILALGLATRRSPGRSS
jgi:quinol-cytochrome oxidoreductase complex cytochrome b subunit